MNGTHPSLQDLLRRGWIRSGNLLVPAPKSSSRMSERAQRGFALHVSYQDLFGNKWTEDDIVQQISRYPVQDIAVILARVGLLLENDNQFSRDLQRFLVNHLFAADIRKRLLREVAQYPDRPVITEQGLLTLFKYAIRFARAAPRDGIEENKLYKLGELLLAVSDHMYDDFRRVKERAELTKEEMLISFGVQNLAFNSPEDPFHLIARYYSLFVKLPAASEIRQRPDAINIAERFEQCVGINLLTYLAAGFGLMTNLATLSISSDDLDPNKAIIDREKYFQNTDISPDIQARLFSLVAATPDEMSEVIKKNEKDIGTTDYNFLAFQQRPLLQFTDSLFVPISLRFLKEKFTAGVYWTLFDYFRDRYGPRGPERFTGFFGYLFECYVRDMLKRMFPQSNVLPRRLYFEEEYRQEGRRVCDAIIAYGDAAIFIEITSGRPQTMKTIIGGQTESLEADLEKLVFNKARQLHQTISAFRKGRISLESVNSDIVKDVYPVIVALKPIPRVAVVWRRICRDLEDKNLLQEPGIARLEILSAEELEILEQIVQERESLLEILRTHLNDLTFKSRPLRDMLLFQYGTELKRSDFLQTVLDECFDEMTAILFPEQHGSI